MHFYVLVSFYFITFTPKCFALAVAAVSAELSAILLNKPAELYNFCAALLILHLMANSAQNSACAESQNSNISNYQCIPFLAKSLGSCTPTSLPHYTHIEPFSLHGSGKKIQLQYVLLVVYCRTLNFGV